MHELTGRHLTAPRHSDAALLVLLLLLAGCTTRETAAAVDSAQARQTLKRVLDGWKSGRSIESFRDEVPEVVVQDMDWRRDCALVEPVLTVFREIL
jgi:hypothetical protein